MVGEVWTAGVGIRERVWRISLFEECLRTAYLLNLHAAEEPKSDPSRY
jgi:hypothetical protein